MNNGNGDDHAPAPETPRSPRSDDAPAPSGIEERLGVVEGLCSAIAQAQAHGFAMVSSDHREMRTAVERIERSAMLERRQRADDQAATMKSIEALTEQVKALRDSDTVLTEKVDEARASLTEDSRAMTAQELVNRKAKADAELAEAAKRLELDVADRAAALAHRKARNQQVRQVLGVLVLLALTALTAYLKGSGWLP